MYIIKSLFFVVIWKFICIFFSSRVWFLRMNQLFIVIVLQGARLAVLSQWEGCNVSLWNMVDDAFLRGFNAAL